jgi:hypothetical protein
MPAPKITSEGPVILLLSKPTACTLLQAQCPVHNSRLPLSLRMAISITTHKCVTGWPLEMGRKQQRGAALRHAASDGRGHTLLEPLWVASRFAGLPACLPACSYVRLPPALPCLAEARSALPAHHSCTPQPLRS